MSADIIPLYLLWPYYNSRAAIFRGNCSWCHSRRLTKNVHLMCMWCANTDNRWSSLITFPPTPPTLTHFKQLSTQTYLCCFDESPDHIFTVDNLFPAGCSTQTIHRQSEEIHEKPHKTRNRKQYALYAGASDTTTRLQQVCLLLIFILLVTDCQRGETYP